MSALLGFSVGFLFVMVVVVAYVISTHLKVVDAKSVLINAYSVLSNPNVTVSDDVFTKITNDYNLVLAAYPTQLRTIKDMSTSGSITLSNVDVLKLMFSDLFDLLSSYSLPSSLINSQLFGLLIDDIGSNFLLIEGTDVLNQTKVPTKAPAVNNNSTVEKMSIKNVIDKRENAAFNYSNSRSNNSKKFLKVFQSNGFFNSLPSD